MSRYNFRRLIQKYSRPFTILVNGEITYIGGEPVTGEGTRIESAGAVLPYSSRLIYQSGGAVTEKDRQLYTMEPIPFPQGRTEIIYQGQRYSIEGKSSYTDYSDFEVYNLKWLKEEPPEEGGSDGEQPDTAE